VGEKLVPACGQSHLPEQVKNAAQKPMNSGLCSGWVCEYMVFYACRLDGKRKKPGGHFVRQQQLGQPFCKWQEQEEVEAPEMPPRHVSN